MVNDEKTYVNFKKILIRRVHFKHVSRVKPQH